MLMLHFILFKQRLNSQITFPFYPILTKDDHVFNYFDFKPLLEKEFNNQTGWKVWNNCRLDQPLSSKQSNCSSQLLDIIKNKSESYGDIAFIIGTIYEYGLFGFPVNFSNARLMYNYGDNHPECQANLAYFQYYGIGGEKNITASLKNLKASKDYSIFSKLLLINHYYHNYQDKKTLIKAYRLLLSLSSRINAHLSPYFRFCHRDILPLIFKIPPIDKNLIHFIYSDFCNFIEVSNTSYKEKIKSIISLHPNYTNARNELQEVITDLQKENLTNQLIYPLFFLGYIDVHSFSDTINIHENTTSSGFSTLEKCLNFSKNPLCSTEIAAQIIEKPYLHNKKNISRIKELLSIGVSHDNYFSISQAGYLIGKGKYSFGKNYSLGYNYILRSIGNKNYSRAYYYMAKLIVDEDEIEKSSENNLKKAFKFLMKFLEESPVFGAIITATNATFTKDPSELKFAYAIYAKLALFGSKTFKGHALKVKKLIKKNTSFLSKFKPISKDQKHLDLLLSDIPMSFLINQTMENNFKHSNEFKKFLELENISMNEIKTTEDPIALRNRITVLSKKPFELLGMKIKLKLYLFAIRYAIHDLKHKNWNSQWILLLSTLVQHEFGIRNSSLIILSCSFLIIYFLLKARIFLQLKQH